MEAIKCHFKKKRQQPSIKKVIIARPRTSQQSDVGLLTRVGIDYSLHPKCLHLLTSVLHVWPFILFKKLWKYYLFYYDMFYHNIYFKYIIIIFTFSQIFWIRRMVKCDL
jgi:hypothetical protein